jgi:hypothetical protein
MIVCAVAAKPRGPAMWLLGSAGDLWPHLCPQVGPFLAREASCSSRRSQPGGPGGVQGTLAVSVITCPSARRLSCGSSSGHVTYTAAVRARVRLGPIRASKIVLGEPGTFPGQAVDGSGTGGCTETSPTRRSLAALTRSWESNWEPTPTTIRPRWATFSHGHGWPTARRATSSHVQRPK